MNDETARRLEAWFDGECSPQEGASLEALLAASAEAREYLESLKRTRAALQRAHLGNPQGASAWQALAVRLDARPRAHSVLAMRFPQLLAAAAAILVLGMLLWLPLRKAGNQQEFFGLESAVQLVETDLEGAIPIVYIDQPSGWTVVWIMEAEESPGRG